MLVLLNLGGELLVLRARLLGTFEFVWQDRHLAGLNGPRLQSVLAYLALHRGTSHSRQHIASTFWPYLSEDKARNNLRQLVHQFRRTLPDSDHYLQVDMHSVCWLISSDFSFDVADFENAVAQASIARKDGNLQQALSALERAASLYKGDLLPDCFDEWITPERERLRQLFADVLEQMAILYEAQSKLSAAITTSQHLLALDSLREQSYLTLMRLYALNDDRASAIRIYQAGIAAFKSEMGIEPGTAMREAYERLKQPAVQQLTAMMPREQVDVRVPLIGRQHEWDQLLSAWGRAVKGEARFILISGEAGIGKTRLAEELVLWVGRQGISVANSHAYAAEGRLSFAPVTEWLRSHALYGVVKRLDKVWLSEVGRILPEIFVEQPHLQQPAAMTESVQRIRLFEALARTVLAVPQPTLLVLDDVQWCDQDTLEWLRFLLRFDSKARILIVATHRTEETDDRHPLMALLHDLRNAGQINEIDLKRLDAAETAKIASHILKRTVDLSEATRLYDDTEGNPLFTVEMARSGLNRSLEIKHDAGLNLPPRIHAVITSRFAQLSEPATELMQLEATIGRAFTLDVLAKASGADEESLLQSLDELWRRRIVRSEYADCYDFTHDKLREVAYAQIGPAKRRLLHRRVARAIEAVHVLNPDPVSAQLAAHYEKAGMPERAVEYYQRAAVLMQRIFAHEEANKLIERALALLPEIRDQTKRNEQEYALVTMMGIYFGVTKRFQAVEQFKLLVKAQALGEKLSKPPNPIILRTLATNYLIRGSYAQSLSTGTQLLELAEKMNDPMLIVQSHEALGIINFWIGKFDISRVFLEKALEHYDPSQSQAHIAQFSWDSQVICLCRLALDLCCLGHIDQAKQAQKESIAVAHSLGHPFTLGYTLFWDALLHHALGNVDQVREQTQVTIDLSKERNLSWWLCQATTLNAWALAEQNELTSGIEKFQRDMEVFFEMGTGSFMRPFYLTLLAELYSRLGKHQHSCNLLQEALQSTQESDERWHEAELHRTRGDVLLAMGADAYTVENAYQCSIAVAKDQHALLYELRASLHLARMWKSCGKREEALQLLMPIYNWFTEGFDARDLQDARALLNELTLP